ncbi:MAG: hypothetical protein JWO15_3650 [Sphingomonadales bacterium]|nr:hypothetical protein [Sphingomonadales bacterium]
MILRPLDIKTIYSDDFEKEVPERFRTLFRVFLPAKYVIFILFGAAALTFKVPAVTEVTSMTYNDIWAFMVGLTAAVSLLGLIFRLEKVELYATIALVVGIATYPFFLVTLVIGGQPDRLAAAIGLVGFLFLPSWRILDIVRVIRRREEIRSPRQPGEF